MKNHSEKLHFTELSEAQLRQLSDAQAVFLNLVAARDAVAAVRGSMRWKRVNGADYLVRVSARGAERSLGRRNAELEEVHASFHLGKQQAETRYRAMRVRAEEMRRLNRAYRVGRTPPGVVKRLDAIAKEGLSDQVLLIGTNALYAYETAAGVRVVQDVLAAQEPQIQYDPVASDLRKQAGAGAPFCQMVVATTGEMAMMRTLHPLDFIRREAKRLRHHSNRLQIEVVQQLWDLYLSRCLNEGSK